MSVANAREVREERFGGINLRDDDIEDFEARDILNMVGKPRGGVKTRDGSVVFNSAALNSTVLPSGYRFTDLWAVGYQKVTALHSIGGGQINLDARPALLGIAMKTSTPVSEAASDAKVISLFGDGTVIDHGTLLLFSNVVGQTGNGYYGVETGPGAIYLGSTGSGQAWFIGGTSDTIQPWGAVAGTFPQGNVLKWWSGRMLITGIRNNAHSIAASAIGDAEYWSTTADVNGKQGWTVELEPGDGDVIVGVGAVGTYLAVFKRRRCWLLYDGDNGANHILSPDLGATSRLAIVETPHGLCWQAQDYSIWSTDGSGVKRLSEKVEPLLSAAAALGYADDHLYISIPGVGTLDHDFLTGEWRRHSLLSVRFAGQDFDDGQGQRLFGLQDPTSAGKNIWQHFVPGATSDAGGSFYSYYATAHRKYGTEVLKRITELRVEGTGNVDVSFSKERQADSFQRSVSLGSTWGQGSVLTPGKARSWGFKFENTGPFSLDAYSANLRLAKS